MILLERGGLTAFDLHSNTAVFEVATGEQVGAAEVCPTGRWLALARGPDCDQSEGDSRCSPDAKRPIEILETKKFTHATTLQAHTGTVEHFAFSPTGNALASGAADHSVAIGTLPP